MAERVTDPVCGMAVDKSRAVPLRKADGVHYFCSNACKEQFEAHDHSAHHAHMVADFKKRFWVSLVVTVPVLILSPMIQMWLHFSLAFPGDKYLLFALSSFVFFYGGWPFLKGLYDELQEKRPGMMTLIALAITVAYVYSSIVTFGLPGAVFFWELVTLIDIMLLGHWIEMRSVMGASAALDELARLLPSEAHRFQSDGSTEDVALQQINKGDRVLIKPGERVPVDGTILDGQSEVNEAMLTGESTPVGKQNGDAVIGGSVNGTGSLTVEVHKTGEDSYLSQVVKLVREAGQSKSRAQGLADKAAFWLTIIAISVGTLTLVVWLARGQGAAFALERTVTVMVITCPHALGLAVPLVIAVITSLSARHGLLVRNRTSFENARRLTAVMFDKTGTLTKGEFGVSDCISSGDWSKDDLLRRAASVETNSEHTIAAGIVRAAKERKLKLSKATAFQAIPGKGARAVVDGITVYVGNRGILDDAGVAGANDYSPLQGRTTVLVAAEGKVQGVIGLSDIIREESREAVRELKSMGLEVAMITGDNQATAKNIADELGIDTYFAEVLPDRKSQKVKDLQAQGKKVAMVGDGVNDAPALAQADVGIAIGAGTDVAVETADVVLVKNDPRNVVDVIRLSRITQRKMVQNLAWATGYNVIAIPLAAGVLFRYGIVLPPAAGAVVMSLSTVIVAINAKLIRYDTRSDQQ
jgi:Cu2+-exporting ATPase